MNYLKREFESLKKELFGDNKIVEQDENPKWLRYNQLLGYFYPSMRTKNWIDPSKGALKMFCNIAHSDMRSKGDIMKFVYSEEESEKIDSALPLEWIRAEEQRTGEMPPIHSLVMNYNEPNPYGKIEDIRIKAFNKLIEVFQDNDSLEDFNKYLSNIFN